MLNTYKILCVVEWKDKDIRNIYNVLSKYIIVIFS